MPKPCVLTVLDELLARAGPKRVYALGGDDKMAEVKYAVREGQRAEKGTPIASPDWTHACVEGDPEWTDLTTGESVPEGCRYGPWNPMPETQVETLGTE